MLQSIRGRHARTRFRVIDGELCEATVTRGWLPVIVHAVIFAGGLAIGMLAIMTGLVR